MNKTLKNIINKTIEREYANMMVDYIAHLNKSSELKEDYSECHNKITNIMEQLYKVLPEEKHYLISDFEEIVSLDMAIESKVAFKEGLILGLTELSYLSEVGQEIAFI